MFALTYLIRRRPAVCAAAALFAATAFGAGIAAAEPPMDNALVELQRAKRDLEMARHERGGHNVEAIRLIDQAMEQVRAGIDHRH